MCGIALLLGNGLKEDDAQRFAAMAASIAPRGESLEQSHFDDALLATSRLKIVDRDHAQQPWSDATGRWSLCFNGEIFNHDALRLELQREGRTFRSHADTEVVLEAFLTWGEAALLAFRGEFAFAVYDRAEESVFVARDPAGIKPLYWAHQDGRLFLASEIKALVDVAELIVEVPPGHCGTASATMMPILHPYIDLMTLGRDEPAITDVDLALGQVRDTVRAAIARRVDTDLPVGVILSGGLDSSIVATEVARLHPDCVAFTVGAPGSEDLEYAKRLSADLGIEHVVIELEPRRIGRRAVKRAVEVAECSEYGDAINAVVSMEIFAGVHKRGIKVVLVGDGSDELFGGYDMYQAVDSGTARRLFLHKIRQLSRTELQRVDRTSMGQQVEARVPYLDLDLLLLSMRIPLEFKVRDGYEKWILRRAFEDVLPDYILARHKNPMSHSSGLHERIRLYKPWMAKWYRASGYEVHEPMHRDFSIELLRANNDFEAAVVAAQRHEDYSASERAKDFGGALAWNVRNALAPGRSSRAGRTAEPQ
jgi:asparagine synthase (glutamine-hydrolysing)